MDSISVHITKDVAAELLPLLEKRRAAKAAEFNTQLNALDAEILSLKTAIHSPTEQSNSASEQTNCKASEDRNGQRIKRGEGPSIVGEFLQRKNGEGAKMKEIVDGTGLIYTTAVRAIKQLKREKRIRSYGGSYRWKLPQTQN
jgi:hypothetical protein